MDPCAFCQLFSAITSLMQIQMKDHLKKGHQEEYKHECNCDPKISTNKLTNDNFQYEITTDLKDEDSSSMMQRDESEILVSKSKSYDDVVNYRQANVFKDEDSSNLLQTDENEVGDSNSKLSEDLYLKYRPTNNFIDEESSKLLQKEEIKGEVNFVDKQIEINNIKSIEEDRNEPLGDLDLVIKHETEGSDIHYNNTDKQLDLIKDRECIDVNKIHVKSTSKSISRKKGKRSKPDIKEEPEYFLCDECGDQFSKLEDVKIHSIEKHFQAVGKITKKHSCNICFKQYSGHSGLLAHKETHVDKRVKEYMCDECPKSFFKYHTLNHHKLRHYEISENIHKPKMEKLYTCDECGLSFKANNNLKGHKLRRHSLIPQIKPHHCSKCIKAFFSGSELRKHERVHTDEKPFSCSKCSKRFQQSYSVKIHERTHTGEKPYQCETCVKSFASLFKLVRHRRIHTGDKPYSCVECSASFSQSGNLKTHLKTCKISQANSGQL